MDYELKVNGEIEEIGGARIEDKKGKPRYDLIPIDLLERVAMIYAKGAERYGERNMENGNSEYLEKRYGSVWRHYVDFLKGKDDEDHMAALIWNILTIEFLRNKLK